MSVHEVLGRHKREAPGMFYLRNITDRNDVHPHAISLHDRYNLSNGKTISQHFCAICIRYQQGRSISFLDNVATSMLAKS